MCKSVVKSEKSNMTVENRLKELEKKIGYTFRDLSLLKQALMHSSYTNEKHLPK